MQTVKKAFKYIFVSLLLLVSTVSFGQNHIREAMKRAKEQREALARKEIFSDASTSKGGYLTYRVENGDTTFYDTIDPVWIFGHGKRSDKDWRKYYKLVYNFAKVYPYAEAAASLQHKIDSTIEADKMNRFQRDRYMTEVQKHLFADFEGALRHMTISQGGVLLKLIDRETSQSSYSIIKEYKNGIAAVFWQGVAKIFDNDLKSQYDPEGADRDLEELVQMWKNGTFKRLYWSIFWEDPPEVKVPDYYKGG